MYTTISQIAGVLLLLFLFSSCGSVKTDSNSSDPFAIEKNVPTTRATYVEKEFMKKTNAYRQSLGKQPIPHNSYLSADGYKTAKENARNHSRTGLMRDAISHDGFYDFKAHAQKNGWGWVSENVGMAFATSDQEAVDRLYATLLKSPGHLKILRRDIYSGNGVAVAKRGSYYFLVHRFGDYVGERKR